MHRGFLRMVVLWVAALPVAMTAALAAADYPAKPLRLIVPFAPGGGNDLLARLVSTQLASGVGQQVLVDNRPGASGITATDIVAKSPPDGYTMLLGFIGPLALLPALTKLPYDPAADFTPLDFLAKSYHILVVNPSLQVRSVHELIALAKREPGKLNYASSGQGANLHLVTELFKNATGIDMVHVPYKGAGPATTAVIAGEAQVLFGSIASSLSYVRANRLVALAVTSPQRSPLAPELPTLVESGIADIDVPSWYTLQLPARAPREIADRLKGELRRVTANPDFVEQLARQAIDAQMLAPGAYAGFLNAEIDKWSAVVRKNGIRVD
jgi:tripartite-type tricarboxylate transporter receptor subunit TctC